LSPCRRPGRPKDPAVGPRFLRSVGVVTMPRGQVKWFSDQKGYGFIQQEDGGQDVFVHHSNITMDGFRSLAEGQAVEYELESGPKGPKAVNVRLV